MRGCSSTTRARTPRGTFVERNRVGNPAVGTNQEAISTGSSSDELAVQNRLHNVNSGIVFAGSTGKYQGNLSTGVAAPYTGGTNAENKQ